MFWEVGLLVTTLAAAISASIGAEPPQGGSGIDAIGAIINKSNPFGGLGANGVIINETELLTIYTNDLDFDDENSIEGRAKEPCKPSNLCTLANGYCVKSRDDCDGAVDAKGCSGKGCKCCVPQSLPECSDFPGFLPLLGTSKCVKVFDDVSSMTWYEANLKCQREGLTPVKTSNVNALDIRSALVDLLGDAGTFGWLDARFNGVQYVWGDGEVIANDNVLWHPGHPILKPDYCMVILNGPGFIGRSPTTTYWSDACTSLDRYRKAFCEFDLNSLRE